MLPKTSFRWAAQSVPRNVFRYTVEIVLDKTSGETRRRLVARCAETDLVVWLKLNVPDGSRYVYALVEGMLAILGVTDIGAESSGGYDGDEWVIDASRIWIWRGPFLSDGVNPEQPMMWAPSIPPNSTYADLNLARRIIEIGHPALVWWPDRRRQGAEIGSAEPPRSRPHLIRYTRR
jgi:hypothetical protein